MAIQPRDKLEDFKYSVHAVVSPRLAHTFGVLAQGAGIDARDVERAVSGLHGQDARTQDNEILMSNGSIEGQTARSGQFTTHQRKLMEERRSGKKTGGIDAAFLQLLNDIEAMDRRLAELRDEIDQYEAKFEAQYGSEWRETFAETYLSDEDMAAFEGLTGKERDQAIIEALKAKMLDENGDIKPEYAGLEVAKYLQTLDEKDGLIVERNAANEVYEAYERGEIEEIPQVDGMMAATTSKLGAQFNGNASVLVPADEKAKLEEVREAQDSESIPDAQTTKAAFLDFKT